MAKRPVLEPESDSSPSPPPSPKPDKRNVPADEVRPRRGPPREAAKNAHRVWDLMAPKTRAKPAEDNKPGQKATKRGAGPTPKPVAKTKPSECPPPDIPLDTSEDEEIDPRTQNSSLSSSKKSKNGQTSENKSKALERLAASSKPTRTKANKGDHDKQAGKGKKKAEDVDSESETEKEGDGLLTPSSKSGSESSGLEELEKCDPGAVEEKFAKERVTWADADETDDTRENDAVTLDDLPFLSGLVSPVRSPAGSPSRSPAGSPVHSPAARSSARSSIRSPAGSPIHSPADSPIRSRAAGSPTHPSTNSPVNSPIHSPVRHRIVSPLRSLVGSPAGSRTQSPLRTPAGSLARASIHPSSRPYSQSLTSTSRPDRRRRDDSSEDDTRSSPVPPPKKRSKPSSLKERERQKTEKEREDREDRERRKKEKEREERERRKREKEREERKKEKEREERKKEKEREERKKEKEREERKKEKDERKKEKENDERERKHESQAKKAKRAAGVADPSTGSKSSSGQRTKARIHNNQSDEDVAPGPSKQKRKRQDEEISWVKTSREEGFRPNKRRDVDDHDSDLPSDCEDDDERIDIICVGGRPNLGDQYPRVYRVAVRAIKEVETFVGTVNAFPEGDTDGHEYLRDILIKHASALKYKEMVKRLKNNKNKKYWKRFASILSQRVSLLRGRVKKLCEGVVRGTFGLTIGDSAKVAWLLKGIAYTYPHDYKAHSVVSTEEFNLSIFEDMLQAAFFCKRSSYGHRVSDLFTSSLPDEPDEKEIPAAMLGLVSTAIYAAIDDFKFARYETQKFEANVFIQAYRKNMQNLSEIKRKNTVAYHRLMHGLYVRVSGLSGGPSGGMDATDYLDAEGME